MNGEIPKNCDLGREKQVLAPNKKVGMPFWFA